MRTFDYTFLQKMTWDNEIVNFLSQIHELKGKQTVYLRQKPDEIEKLVAIAKVQSTESSNAIEGIRTTETRLKQLMQEKTTPKSREEKEIAGYRDALNTVHENFEYIPLTPNYILQLHKIMFRHTDSAFGGSFKNVQNYISATTPEGKTYTLFTPLAPYETPDAVQSLCDAYNRAAGEGKTDALLLIPCFIHDFLCIHPFIDGNGRMRRLLTTLCCIAAAMKSGGISLSRRRSPIQRASIMTLWRRRKPAGMRAATIRRRLSGICSVRSLRHTAALRSAWSWSRHRRSIPFATL